MNELSYANSSNNSVPITPGDDIEQMGQNYLPAYLDTIFQQLEPRDVEQFYRSYHLWLLQRRTETLYTEIGAVQQAIIDNHTLMQQVHPSAIALASLAQLQASGVSDLNLLDRMLERGETWLDRTMQQLEQCEKMDVIRGDYTQWCEHALDGAYEWIASMDAIDSDASLENEADEPAASVAISDEQQLALQTITEEQLLQKLMSDEDATDTIPALHEVPDEENGQSVVQEVVINNKKVETSSKDADVHKVKTLSEERIGDAPDQTDADAVGMVASQRKSKKPRRQRGRRKGFFRSLLVSFYRKQ